MPALPAIWPRPPRSSISITTAISTSSSPVASTPSSCCATTATARSPTSPRPPAFAAPAARGRRRRADRFRQSPRHRSADRRADGGAALLPEHARRHVPRRGADAGLPPAGAYSRSPPRRRQQGRLPRLLLRHGATGRGVLALSDGDGPLRASPRPATRRAARSRRSSSTTTTTACSICSMLSNRTASPVPQPAAAAGPTSPRGRRSRRSRRAASAFQSLALGDLDGDGDTDVVDPD